MKLPSRDLRLAGGLLCPATPIERSVWLEHVTKHPLGVSAIARSRGRDAWNLEGWDRLAPPVISEPQRAELVKGLAGLSEGKQRCEVPEVRGKKSGSDPDRLACRDCTVPIIARCEQLMHVEGGVGQQYAAVIESLLLAVDEGQGLEVAPAKFQQAVHRLWRSPSDLDGLVVLTVGLDDRRAARPIARLSRHDGVRAEFYLEEPNRLRWRTAYRNFVMTRTGPQVVSFLGDVARPAPKLGRVSDLCVVPRRWWETHGI